MIWNTEESDILPILDTLTRFDVHIGGARLEWIQDLASALGCLGSVSWLSVEAGLDPAITELLARPQGGTFGYLCPNLTDFKVANGGPAGAGALDTFWESVRRRQVAASQAEGPKKLQVIHIPRSWSPPGDIDISLDDLEIVYYDPDDM
ncbi:hypothetical protein FRB90_002884 [Tulasnella sp. 427]|nr:hypothetical protein FRB90_002884 [Tulasnella sp. 427]